MAREIFGKRKFPREPEPDLVMEDADRIAAYAYAGRIDGVMSAAYLYHSARISQVIWGCTRVLDLGCGPATQLGQVAQLNPEVSFLGVDLSPAMLDSGRAYVDSLGLRNVQFQLEDIARMDGIPDASVDAVMSTMVLHHLPTRQHLDACFRQITRILKPGGAIYLTDFGRLKSLKSVLFFAYMNAEYQPHLFSLDYECSLRAAFSLEDFQVASANSLPSAVRVFSTFQVPLLVTMKTAAKPLPAALLSCLQVLRAALPRSYRKDLDELRYFVKLDGYSDPFSNAKG